MKSSFRQKGKSLFWAVQEILFTIAKKIGFNKEKFKKLEKINRIVFSGKEKNWKTKFKFDISFNLTGKEIQGVRFSCNNKDEGRSWIKKIEAVFDIFPGVYNQRRVIGWIKKEKFDSLTIGLDWSFGEKEPKFKLYFEGNKNKIEKFVRDVLNVKVLKLEKFLSSGLSPCALGINFLPNNEITYKIYFYINKDKLRQDYFFLLAIDFSEKSEIFSKKIYLIYETREFREKSGYLHLLERYDDVKKVLTKTETKYLEEKINLFNKKTLNKFLIYPIGFSISLTPKHNFGHKNIYISLIKKNAEK